MDMRRAHWKNMLPDSFVWLMLLTVALASFLPASGTGATVFGVLTRVAIALLFFLHGAKLSRAAVIEGVLHWRMHLAVLGSTFLLFPVLGVVMRPFIAPFLGEAMSVGVLYLTLVPSTVQSSIVFTSIARGNVPGAVCSASISNVAGIFLTPLLVAFLIAPGKGGMSADSVVEILLLLLLPFVVGQLVQKWAGGPIRRHPALVRGVDKGSILLIVYTAFSASVLDGLWRETPVPVLLNLVLVCGVLLAVVMILNVTGARLLRFSKEDEITILFCGSKKSLATGVPMAQLLFATQSLGAMVLPLMVFHQMQLMVCAVLADRYARRPDDMAAGATGSDMARH